MQIELLLNRLTWNSQILIMMCNLICTYLISNRVKFHSITANDVSHFNKRQHVSFNWNWSWKYSLCSLMKFYNGVCISNFEHWCSNDEVYHLSHNQQHVSCDESAPPLRAWAYIKCVYSANITLLVLNDYLVLLMSIDRRVQFCCSTGT